MKNEFVMVPRKLTREMLGELTNGDPKKNNVMKLRWEQALKVAPAEQHHGEPVAWRYRHSKPGMSWFFTEKTGADGCLIDGFDYEVQPLYTHADPGEVERLRSMFDQTNADLRSVTAERDTLRAQVEKLQAGFYQQVTDADLKKIADYVSNPDLPKGAFLRQDAYDLANMCMHMVREVQASRAQLAERDSFIHDLEANCDPAGTVRENVLFRDQLKQVNAMVARLKSELAERDALLRDISKVLDSWRSTDDLEEIGDRVAAMISASAEPSAPDERDERAAFEKEFAAKGRPLTRADYDPDAYGNAFDDGAWTGWQARAALERKS